MKWIKALLPYRLKRSIKEQLGVPSLHWSLQNIKRYGFNPNFALDIGAYHGEWTLAFKEVFPYCQVLMLKAQPGKKGILEKVKMTFSDVDFHIALLAAKDGNEYAFFENETASHVSTDITSATLKLKGETLDTVLQDQNYPLPDFIKIDVQGFELEVLRGGKKALQHTTACLLEVTLLDLDNSPLVLEVMQYMDKEGFQLYDITQFMRRPYDKALYQSDFLFIKKDSKLVAAKRWR